MQHCSGSVYGSRDSRAIAKHIVEMRGGRIWVEATLGKGSTFQMELPIRAEFRKVAP
jgi:signal transduction histidine kinase